MQTNTTNTTRAYLTTKTFQDFQNEVLNVEYWAAAITNPVKIGHAFKMLHNLAVKYMVDWVDYLNITPLFKWFGNEIKVRRRDNDNYYRNWFTNYYLFGGWITTLASIFPTPNAPIFGNNFWGAVVGGLIQGYDECPAQQKISEKYPYTAILAGIINGATCCAAQSMVTTILGVALPLSGLLGFVTTWAFSSSAMCYVESKIFKKREAISTTGMVQVVWEDYKWVKEQVDHLKNVCFQDLVQSQRQGSGAQTAQRL